MGRDKKPTFEDYGNLIISQNLGYLGVTVDSKGSYKLHVHEKRKQGAKIRLSTETFLYVYQTCVQPLLLYGSEGWYQTDESDRLTAKLEKTRRFAIKLAFGLELSSPLEDLHERSIATIDAILFKTRVRGGR